MKSNWRVTVRWVLRVLITAVFVVSALAKLWSIDEFELYVYSYGFLPLNACFVLARLCIGVELAIGAMTLIGRAPRTLRVMTVGMLVCFSLFLCYAMLVGRNESCQCFGQLAEMNPAVSLLKNGVLIALTLWFYRLMPSRGRMRRGQMAVMCVVSTICIVMPFVVSVPDSWLFGPGKERYGKEVLATEMEEEGTLWKAGVGEERKILAFVTPKCPYCKLARGKLELIVSRHDIDKNSLVFIEPQLKENTEGATVVSSKVFLEITKGARPLVMLMDGKKVVATFHLRNIEENEIVEFMKK